MHEAKKVKKKISIIIKAVCSIALLAYLFSRMDFSMLLKTMSGFNPWIYILAILGVFIYQYLFSIIIKQLLFAKGNKAGTWEILRLLTISIFFGTALPGGAGPDIIFAYNLSRSTPKKEDALSALIFTRMLVTFTTLLIASVVSLLPGISKAHTGTLNIRILVFMFAGAFLALYLVLSSEKVLKLSEKLFVKHRWANLIYQTHFAISKYGRNRNTLLIIIPVAVLASACKVTADYIIAISLGIDISLLYFFIFIPIISIVTMIPVTIAGIGIRENAYVRLFSTVGLKNAESFSISILSFSIGLLFCIAGAILYWIKGSALKISSQTDNSSRFKK